MKEEKVFMEKFNNFEIYYDKEKERFVADKEDLDIHFEAARLWEIKGYIKETRTEEVNQRFFIKSGYFEKSIAKINLLTKNQVTKRGKYKILEDTEKSYDVGRIQDGDIPRCYPINDHNIDIYDKVATLQEQIKALEEKQKDLIKTLK